MSPDNSPSKNLKIAQVGKFWETTEFVQAWHWRSMLMLCSHPEASKLKRTKAATIREIGKVVGKAVAEGNWLYLKSLAEAVEFVNERIVRNPTTQEDFMNLSHWDESWFTPEMRLPALIVREYYMRSGGAVDEAKKARKTFMPYIAALLGREVDAKGAFAKAFGRACTDAGIKWRK